MDSIQSSLNCIHLKTIVRSSHFSFHLKDLFSLKSSRPRREAGGSPPQVYECLLSVSLGCDNIRATDGDLSPNSTLPDWCSLVGARLPT